MPNIYLKVAIGKNRHFKNFDFLSLKNLLSDQFLESSTQIKKAQKTEKVVKKVKIEFCELRISSKSSCTSGDFFRSIFTFTI